jgi:uncharacterized protein (DUF2345 family)
LLVSRYKIMQGADARDPAGDSTAGMALLKQAVKLGETSGGAATTHETVVYASHLGAAEANSIELDVNAALLKAMLTATSGMLSQENVAAAKAKAPKKPVRPGYDKLPYSSDAIIAVTARAGLGVVAGQNLQLTNGERITMMGGQDTQLITGGRCACTAARLSACWAAQSSPARTTWACN